MSDQQFGELQGRVRAVERECDGCRQQIVKSLDAIFGRLSKLEIDTAVAKSRRSEMFSIAAGCISLAALAIGVIRVIISG